MHPSRETDPLPLAARARLVSDRTSSSTDVRRVNAVGRRVVLVTAAAGAARVDAGGAAWVDADVARSWAEGAGAACSPPLLRAPATVVVDDGNAPASTVPSGEAAVVVVEPISAAGLANAAATAPPPPPPETATGGPATTTLDLGPATGSWSSTAKVRLATTRALKAPTRRTALVRMGRA